MRPRLAQWKVLLDHDLSPAPIFAVFLGYWLPLEWMLNWGVVAGIPLIEKAHVIASSATLNYGLTASCIYLLICLIGAGLRIFGFSASRGIRIMVSFSTWLAFIAVTLMVAKNIVFSGVPVSNFLKSVLVVLIALFSLYMVRIKKSFSDAISVPMLLSQLVLFFSIVLNGHEYFGPRVGTCVSRDKEVHDSTMVSHADVLFVTLDALSARHFSWVGSKDIAGDDINEISRDGIIYDHFYANANWTRPGIASLIGGTRPWINKGDIGSPALPVKDNFLKELGKSGYLIEGVSTNWFAGPKVQNVYDLFCKIEYSDTYFEGHGFLTKCFPSLIYGFQVGPIGRSLPFLYGKDDRAFVEKTRQPINLAKNMLSSPSVHPRFFWLHLITAHDPYAAPPPFLGSIEPSPLARSVENTKATYGFQAKSDPCFPKIYEGRYDEAIRCLDAGLGELFAWLKATGRYDRTLIVITADHGESFTHGYGGHGGPLLSEDLIHIPCLIKPPFHHGAERDERLYEQADLAPTILQMVGLPVPAGMEGYPISEKPEGLPVFAMNHDLQQGTRTFSVAIRLGDWKYVEHWGHWTAPWPQRELYDLASDPGENRNLVVARPDKVAELRGRILAELARRHIDPEKE